MHLLLTKLVVAIVLSNPATGKDWEPAAGCDMPVVHNDSLDPWTPVDTGAVKSRIAYCQRTYAANPCLGYFRKHKERQYTYQCEARDGKRGRLQHN